MVQSRASREWGRLVSFVDVISSWGRHGVWASFDHAEVLRWTPSPCLRHPRCGSGDRDEGWRVLDLCGGMSTVLLALAKAGRKVSKYWLVEIDPFARNIGDNIIRRLMRDFPHIVTSDSVADMVAQLAQDVCAITEEDIVALGRIDLMVAAWPCTDLSSANGDGARGLEGERSALFFHVERILALVFKHNPHCHFLCENVVFRDKFPEAWELINASLGEPVIFDAACVSYAHRLRAYWSSFFMHSMRPEPRDDLRLSHVLHADHYPRKALYTDRAPHALFNVRNQPMAKYVTAVRRWETHNIKDGSGLVRVVGSGAHVRPRVEGLEVILGFEEGDTAAPEIMSYPRYASDVLRWAALGNCIDANALAYIFSFLPLFPIF